MKFKIQEHSLLHAPSKDLYLNCTYNFAFFFYHKRDPKKFISFRPQAFGPYTQLHLPVDINITIPASGALFTFPPQTMGEVYSLGTKASLSISPLEPIFSPFHIHCDLFSYIHFNSLSFISVIILFLSTVFVPSTFKHALVSPLKREI